MNLPGPIRSPLRPAPLRRANRAFTLLEVMIAAGIFFMAMFAILDLVFSNLHAARRIQEARINAGPVAADVYYLTNKWEEGASDRGDFGELYPGYTWQYEVHEFLTNGLYQVFILITHPDGVVETNLSVLYWRPGQLMSGAPPPRMISQ